LSAPPPAGGAPAPDDGRRRFTDLYIRRPVLATVISLLILLLGVQAFYSLPVRQYPKLTNTQITITTHYPGANADLIQGFISTPIQQAVASTDGIDYMTSSSTQNSSVITLNLRLDADGDRALTEVLSKVNQVRNTIPPEAQEPVVVKKTGQTTSLMYIGFNSATMTASQITDYLTRVIQPRLQTINGVAEAKVLGGQTFAMRIWLNPKRMAALGVTPTDIQNALKANNYVSAPGQIKGDFIQTNISAATSPDTARAFANLVVAARGGTLIRLRDVATVSLGPQSVDSSSVFSGLKAVFVGIDATPDANPLTVISDVRKALPDIRNQLPVGLKATVVYDATAFIEASINEVVTTIVEAAVIVIVVIFLFLGSVRSTLIPIVTIPLSLIGVMFLMLAMGFSVNLLTLLAMVLAIGLVVDDAIVVVENIHRHIEEGMRPFDAALKGARDIATPVISMTITLAAVYAPIGFVGGLTGALFKEFAFTLAGAVILSGVIALTLSPMMCARLLRAKGRTSRLTSFLDRRFEGLKNWYQRRLGRVLLFRPVVLMVAAVVLASCVFLYTGTRQELAPTEDQGFVFMVIKAPQYANLDYLEKFTAQLGRILKSVPEYANYFLINGTTSVNQGVAGLLLKPWGDRARSQAQVQAALQPKLNTISGVQIFAFPLPSLPGSTGGPPVQFVIKTTADYRTLYRVLDALEADARKSGMFVFVDSDLKFDNPQLKIDIDRAKANELGINMQDIGIALSTMFGGNYTNRFALLGRSYEVIPQVPRKYRLDPDAFKSIYVRTKGGTLVPLATVARATRSVEPNALTTFQQLNSATIQAVMYPGRSLGEGLDYLRTKAAALFPQGFSYDFQGESRQLVREGNTLAIAFAFAMIVIFLVLAAQFESFRDPLIILIAVPMSIAGALIPMNLGLATVNIYTQVGLVTLIGLISKHGILMVEFANQLQAEEGLDKRAAIIKAATIRLRPILMTTAAMVVAMVPLLIASGAGAKSRFDIGLVIAAGMTIGTMFTLFMVPTIYTYLAGDHRPRGEGATDAASGADAVRP
jgi:hydrophobe/amphiphile efflux-1 (HAE1) family protein